MSGTPSAAGDLVTTWLLVLIRDTPADMECYGWDLGRALAARGLQFEMSTVYRRLRGLERDGYVTGRWRAPKQGPRRRFYVLTTAGLERLDECMAAARTRRAAYDVLVFIEGLGAAKACLDG